GHVGLALRRGADEEVHLAVSIQPDSGRLVASKATRLDTAGEAHAPQAPVGSLAGPRTVYALQRHLEEARVVATVIDIGGATGREAGVVGHLPGLDEVPPPQLGGIHAELP